MNIRGYFQYDSIQNLVQLNSIFIRNTYSNSIKESKGKKFRVAGEKAWQGGLALEWERPYR